MIPILYAASEKEFKSNGLGRLSTCSECKVTEERNGVYECEFTISVNDKRYGDCNEGNIISVTHDETGDRQPFVIYRRSVPIDGMVTFYAHHISYDLSNVILKPFHAESVVGAFSMFGTEALTVNPFTFWTNKVSQGSFTVDKPTSIRAVLGGSSGSILDAFGGGEYEFDKYEVRLYQHRGQDRGVTIRYGKNLIDLEHTIDTLGLYNAVVPFWADSDGNVVYGGVVIGASGISQVDYWTNENGVRITDENSDPMTFKYCVNHVATMDLSNQFDEAPTVAELEAKAESVLNNNEPWLPKNNVKVDFVALWNTDEYKNIAPLERVNLCDTVTVYYSELDVNVKAKVIKTVYNVLTDKYDEIELGAAESSFADVIAAETDAKLAEKPSFDMMAEAIEYATEQITGGNGGNIVFRYDAEGRPTELLIMDTDNIETAVNVWRWNLGGLGHSHNGYSGPFDDVALTQDGRINANLITAGTLSANLIKGGRIDSLNERAFFDLTGGYFALVSGDRLYRLVLRGWSAAIILQYREDVSVDWNDTAEMGGDPTKTCEIGEIYGGVNGASCVAMDVFYLGGYNNKHEFAYLDADGTTHLTVNHLMISGGTSNAYIGMETADVNGKNAIAVYDALYLNTSGTYTRILTSGANGSLPEIKTIYFSTAGSNRYVMFGPESGSTYYAQVAVSSDERLKTNIKDTEESGLDVINRIRHVEFDFIESGAHKKNGYIAQQLVEINDDFATKVEDREGDGFMSVNDHEILTYVTKAIQELSAEVKELRAEIERLKEVK